MIKHFLQCRRKSGEQDALLNPPLEHHTSVPERMESLLLSVVIPVYNEESTVFTLLEKIRTADLPGMSLELIIVDDGSTDRSAEMIRQWINLHG